ncbi:hypothetical protein BH09ACT12_BH09ACT12_28560 [soil metagenome]
MPLFDTRRVRAGLLIAGLILGSALSACGSESTGDTTCGEYTAMSPQEKRDLIREGVDESNDDATQEALDAATDDDLDQVAGIVDTACAAADDDTKLDDLDS